MEMFIGSVVLGFFVTSSLLVEKGSHIRVSLGKFYVALYMAAWMVILDVMINDYYKKTFSGRYYLVGFALVAIVFYLARKQVLIGDQQYLKAMIQHHSSAILTSKAILNKTVDPNVAKLARQIIASQKAEIDQIQQMLGETRI